MRFSALLLASVALACSSSAPPPTFTTIYTTTITNKCTPCHTTAGGDGVMFGKLDNPENAKLKDLDLREIMTLVPIVICCFWIGLYPKPFFRILEKPVADIAQRLSAGEPSSQTTAFPAAPAPSSTIAATAAEGR